MSKSVKERLDALAKKKARIAAAEREAKAEEDRIVLPVCEKISQLVHARLEEMLRKDPALIAGIDLSRDAMKASVDSFVEGMVRSKTDRRATVGSSSYAPSSVEIESQQ